MANEEIRWEMIIIIGMIFFVLSILILMAFSNAREMGRETLERCKAKGWDGITFKPYSSKLICSNFTQAERDAK